MFNFKDDMYSRTTETLIFRMVNAFKAFVAKKIKCKVNFPTVCAILAIDSWNCCSGEQGLTADLITRLHNLLYTTEQCKSIEKEGVTTLCEFPSHKIAHYRESHSLLFNSSYIVKVTFLATTEKLDICHSNVNCLIIGLQKELCLYC